MAVHSDSVGSAASYPNGSNASPVNTPNSAKREHAGKPIACSHVI